MARMERRLKVSSLFIVVGLLVQVLTLLVKHPLSFVVFLAIGCPLMGAGVVLFLLGLVQNEVRDKAASLLPTAGRN